MVGPGPDVFGITSDIPDGCYVDQAAYVSRHGSRYPDTGAHNGWLDMAKIVSDCPKPQGSW
jgi:hypothetical protein